MSGFGQNAGYVDEVYRRYLANPESVSEAWREFFEDYKPQTAEPSPAHETAPPDARPLSGIAARIAGNMEASLAIPTATSVRTIAVKLLEENRRIVNRHQAAFSAAKISFTHLIGWAVLRALEKHPVMNGAYEEVAGVPHARAPRSVNFGVAVDTERKGERILVVPNVKNAQTLDFPGFVAAYDDRVAKARAGTLGVDDYSGTTISLTNPGTLGTTLSVPRLMPGQGAIVGTGAIGYPPEYAGMSDERIAGLGLSKTVTLTSTYDHRVIQGAASGAFLATIESLLLGDDRFYERIFAELGVPRQPVTREPGAAAEATEAASEIDKQAGVIQLIRAFRVRGHLSAYIDPLGSPPLHQDELELGFHNLSVWDLDRTFAPGVLAGSRRARSLREIVEVLRDTYCRYVGVEFMHIQELAIRRWLEERMESSRNAAPLSSDDQARVLAKLNAAEAFEKFLHKAYVGQKRFSLEGAETLVPMLDALLSDAADAGIDEAVIGTSHRGRLNVLSNIVGKSYEAIFREFEGAVDPESVQGSGDVKYHLGAEGAHDAPSGRRIALTLASNPSHLEAVDPVVEGMVRARQDRRGDLMHKRVLPILMHGDAAFAGQGVVAETLNLSRLRGYRTGGTVHIVINNQIGFTTGPQDARSSPYATDVARTVQAPIFHVNGDRPEDAVRIVRLALAFRNAFQRDVVVDLVCYRRWGHNEGDDPSYTHPTLYAKIEGHRSPRKLYTEELLRRGDLTGDDAERALDDFRGRLESALAAVRAMKAETGAGDDAPATPSAGDETIGTVPEAGDDALGRVLSGLARVPDGFEIHPKLAVQLEKRRAQYADGTIEWALAEALAFGTLVLGGVPVRLSGEDSGRGTFSQRHAILYDHRTGARFIPLGELASDQGRFQVYDSHLSEFAVLGFEYGYSVADPDTLVLWEAQFGDFANGGQVIIDQFMASAEAKWGQTSRLTLLLPHGYEGQGPEHSSARLERFLQLASERNLRIASPSTPAQYFHLLRLQALAAERKPLVVMTPKSLLRHKDAVSTAAELAAGRFAPVLDDTRVTKPSAVRRVVLCTGKVAYDLDAARRESTADDVAIVRIEQLYPFPAASVDRVLARYPAAVEICFAQEEPRNMGAWRFVEDRLHRTLRYAGRPESASPATGSHSRHLQEQRALVREALSGVTTEAAPARR
ncbi:MAG TPA: multifunctional oxoglutarate decarboxylase/oxoglutarate dehydrogenase thiamine pyrophosphate-binding subunit/dihydrolipoyllysine-residue succinyltransferase subunit [Candidatus Polarisedimenticolaceae bacterium]|nr:multifunctional oxoglutarate decarboxylase/oxoglutarate dehydrogenase thiamine pyrophosphate-binding subunit/dihydrolipoyllysine-residue succinyltransferase subunit [Candidatus Polarisedimenticolaceae bacterium]